MSRSIIGSVLPLCLCASVVCFLCGAAPKDKPEIKLETFKGKVMPLADILKKFDAELDPEAAPHWLALVTDEGKIYPLIKDAGGQTFYRDAQLLKRPMQIQGRLLPGSQLLQVLQVHSLKDGKPHEVYYWCEVCSIKRFALERGGICECCGGKMDRREAPPKP